MTKTSFPLLAMCTLLAGTTSLASAATATLPEPLTLKYDVATRENAAVAHQNTCPIHVAPTLDERQNKQTIGAGIGGPLLAVEADRWVSDGLLNLKEHGFAVDEVPATAVPQDGSLLVKTTLTRAYTWQVGLKIFSMVALRAEFIDKNGTVQEKYYRAHGDKTNMWGAAAEYVTTLNYGLNNLLPAMANDLVSLCKGTKVEPYTYAGPEPVAKK